MTKEKESTIRACFLLAFEAGKWAGHVELEEHIDRQQYTVAALESVYSRRMTMPLHPTLQNGDVIYRLRSQEWRDGVRKSSKEYLENAVNFLMGAP